MARTLCIFEDRKVENFYPLTLTRPVYDLRCGISTLWEKISQISNSEETSHLLCRDYLSKVTSQRIKRARVNQLQNLKDEDLLFVNGRLLFLDEPIVLEGNEEIAVQGEEIVYARLNKDTLEKLSFGSVEKIEETLTQAKQMVKVEKIRANLLEYPWGLIRLNGKAIRADFKLIGKRGIEGKVAEGAYLINPEQIYLAREAEIEPGVVLNAEEGPIYIGEEVKIRPPTVIDGPSYIGKGTIIDGAKIREGCSVGPVCRIAGEIEESIFYAYSNKHHDGFIGHSYVGEWVNLAALTTTSDLKNTYGEIKVYLKDEVIDTGEIKVGSFIGDHTKTGIGTLLEAGCVIGVSCNLFGGGTPPKFIPSFSWGGEAGFVENELDKVIEVARLVMKRRGVKQTEADRDLLRKVYKLTAKERRKKNERS
jgi:UDP-N-acetylglucosamine diphosphorylase/glucosamine-1-phosphate N-acetyltransferase